MTKNCILSERPSSAIHLQYYAQTRGVKFDNMVIADDTDAQFETLHKYADKNSFNLHFVPEPNDSASTLEQLEPDILAINTPSTILNPEVIDIPRIGTINAHGAILPEYRGYGSSHWALLYNDAVGSSAHLVNEGVDTGAILSTRTIDVSEYETIGDVIAAIYYQCKFQAMIDGIIDLINGTADPQPQTPEDGTQYFEMHPKIAEITEQVLQVEGENKGLQ